MGESLSTWIPSFNRSVRVELSGQRTTGDSGALLLREALDRSGVIDALEDNLVDSRNPLRVRHSLTSQLRTVILQRAMGWIDLSDTTRSAMIRSGNLPAVMPAGWPRWGKIGHLKPRLLNCLGRSDNIDTLHEGLLRLVVWGLVLNS